MVSIAHSILTELCTLTGAAHRIVTSISHRILTDPPLTGSARGIAHTKLTNESQKNAFQLSQSLQGTATLKFSL